MYRRKNRAYLTITLSIDDYRRIEKLSKLANISKAKVIVRALHHVRFLKPEERILLEQINKNLSRLGVNINQIAKHLNSQRYMSCEELKSELHECSQTIEQLKKIIEERFLIEP